MLASQLGIKDSPKRTTRKVRARYDAAVTTADNRRHWANADGLSADAAACPEVRRVLRNRSRYEVANNSIAKGIVLTLANDMVGTGSRLQMLTKSPKANKWIEKEFAAWANAIGLSAKSLTMRMARGTDGESFGVLAENPKLTTPVKLNLRLVEADQVATPDLMAFVENAIDGIVYDSYGNPVTYHVLKAHPGGLVADATFGLEYDSVSAKNVIHYYRADRPGQGRGIPDIMPALPLFAQLRRYTLAVIAAAETAADFAAVIYSDGPPDESDTQPEQMDIIELEKRMATVLPASWKLAQVKAEQPTTTYAEFKREIINEIARCFNMPYNVAAGNSAGYNYASGRLDHQTYFKSIRVEQKHFADVVLDRLFAAWLREAILISDYMPLWVRTAVAGFDMPMHQWFFDGHEHVDPIKEAKGQAIRLANLTTTLSKECAAQGDDWEVVLEQVAREVQRKRELGLIPEVTPEEEEEEEDASTEAAKAA